jgi:signal transduction histidine kinase
LLAEEVLTPVVAQRMRMLLAEQPAWSDFPLLVFTAAARTPAREDSAGLGNVTYLDRPVHVRTMLASVHAALRSRRRQYEARKAIESRDAFLAMLGHELRNPLGAITFALAALERKSGQSPQPPELGIVARQSRHLARLVDELLDVARVTHGKVSIDRQRVDLAEVAKSAFEAYEGRAREHGLAYGLELPPEPLWVLGDRPRLEQIIGNLLTNAIKYTPRGGSVTLQAEQGEGQVSVVVQDTGVGLAEEMRERVFAPFAQVDSSLERSQGGLGLGLALVKSLVTMHAGTVRALSDGIGKGCRFEVSLPVAAPAEVTTEPTTTDRNSATMRVVLVEDNDDIRELFTEMLQEYGHDVTAAADGPSGLDAVLSVAPDIAFVDVGLPGMDGYELARRARGQGSKVRLVALTGYGQKEDKQRAHDAGFDEHLVKPVGDEDIRSAMARAVG